MIAVPWFKFPWTVATGDLAHALVQHAIDGDADAKGQIEQVKAQADGGNKLAVEAWRYFSAIIRLVVAGQPPPSVLLQMKGVQVGHHHGGGHFPGGVMMGPYDGGYPYPGPGGDPWMFEEMASRYDVGGGGGHHHGGHRGGGGWGAPWGGYYEPFYYSELLQSVAERAAEDAAAEVEERMKGGTK